MIGCARPHMDWCVFKCCLWDHPWNEVTEECGKAKNVQKDVLSILKKKNFIHHSYARPRHSHNCMDCSEPQSVAAHRSMYKRYCATNDCRGGSSGSMVAAAAAARWHYVIRQPWIMEVSICVPCNFLCQTTELYINANAHTQTHTSFLFFWYTSIVWLAFWYFLVAQSK